ncbi:MAG: holo-ACP synthase [Eubacteriales bacterium]|nr:holo-ACP synthase [Eubacteriales bacterium]
MLLGTGIDICSVERMEKITVESSFFRKYFSEEEQSYIIGKGNVKYNTMAGIFAAKEAFVKALGTGFTDAGLKEISICHDPQGCPYYKPEDMLWEKLRKLHIKKMHLSISHEAGIAIAMAVAEGEQ